MTERDSCALLVLAAGGSKRLGQPKQLLQIEGEPLIRAVVRNALTANLYPTIVVLGAYADLIRPHLADLPLLLVENLQWQEGLASSLRAGLTALLKAAPHTQGLMVMLADQPQLTAPHLEQIRAVQHASGRSMVASDYGDHLGPPAYFGRSHFQALHALSGDVGARGLLHTFAAQSVAVPAGTGADLDSAADYARLLAATKGP